MDRNLRLDVVDHLMEVDVVVLEKGLHVGHSLGVHHHVRPSDN